MAQTLSAELGDALERTSWKESISRVHDLVGQQLTRLDSAAEIRRTDYFNHSFIPDFVLSWEDSRIAERHVFLRTDQSTSGLLGDLELLGASSPIFLGLTTFTDGDGADPLQNDDSSDDGSMVTDPDALYRLSTERTTNFSSVLPNALVRGGRGLLTGEVSAQLTGQTDSLLQGSTNTDKTAVSSSIEAIRQNLSSTQFREVARLGQVLWEAAGGEQSDYPSAELGPSLTPAALEHLLTNGPPDDLEFWRKVGSTLSISALTSLPSTQMPAFGSAMTANLDRILARCMSVRPAEPSLDVLPMWNRRGRVVELRGSEFAAEFSDSKDDLVELAPPSDGIEKTTFDRRLGQRSVSKLGIRTSGLDVTIEPSGDELNTDLRESERLDELADDVSIVHEATVVLNNRNLDLNFETTTAKAVTSSRFAIEALVRGGLPMLWELGESDQEMVEKMISSFDSVADRARPERNLFDLED